MAHHIPDGWKPLVRAHVLRTRNQDREHLDAGDFRGGRVVRIDWADHSFAVFRYAFCLRNLATKEVAVFTEHCGYYFLRNDGDSVQVTELEQVFSTDD